MSLASFLSLLARIDAEDDRVLSKEACVKVSRVLCVVFALLVPTLALAQTAGQTDSVRFDYADAEIANASVIRFELCYAPAGGQMTCTALATDFSTLTFTPTADQGGPPAAGFKAYRAKLPALMPGISYTAGVRACNAALCGLTGANGALPLSFRFIIEPGTPSNQQLIRGGA